MKKEKFELSIYGSIAILMILMEVGFNIWFSCYKAEQDTLFQQQQIEWNKQHNERLKKLKELQIKYKKDIEDEKRVSQINVFTLNYEDIELLAINNYYESRGVGRKRWKKKERDMQNITSVVLNRLDSGKYGTTIKKVIQGAKKKQNGKYVCQFSWVCDNNRPAINKHSKEWKLAYEVAFQVYTGIVPRTVHTKALHYYNPIKSKPMWAKKAKEVAYVYGGHRIVIID